MQRNAMPRPARRFFRAALLATTGLSALVLPSPARAQTIPANTTPQGGSVAAGSAAITQAPGSTTVNQSSARTVINWQSFNVGSAASVQFNQPSASAIALNRVVTPSPSIIAGQINANGQLVLINQSGVVVTKGADINAESLVLATSNIADKDFLAGNMAFSGAPKPGAKIINDGNITVRDTGLVGLVAPQVENDGVITARLGQVVLAGASAFTLDLYGDRLISLDVTKAVRAVDVGGVLVPALVTNRGLILADGGKITLTARDADALVTQLIDAGGTLRADSVGPQAGTIAISGVGGDITIAGNLLARGGAAGTSGGAVQALTTGTVSVAAAARIDASGAGGGGVIALGTDLTRATSGATDIAAPRAAGVNVAAGAKLSADATQSGNAGRVVLLSQNATEFQGLISVQGGPGGGNGGVAEISSGGVISLGGTVLDTAVDGQSGEVLLDPATLDVTSGVTSNAASVSNGNVTTFGDDSASGVSTLSAASLASLSGTIILEAASLISVGAAIELTGSHALTLASLGDIMISAEISLAGALELDAANTLFAGGALDATDLSLRDSGPGGITIAAPVDAFSLVLQSGGAIAEDGGVITAEMLSGSAAGAAILSAGANTIGALSGFTAGSFDFQDSSTALINAALTAGSITLATPGALDVVAPITATAGDVELASNGLDFLASGSVTAPADARIADAPYTPGALTLGTNGDVLDYVSAGTVVLGEAAGHEATGIVSAGSDSFAGTLLLLASGDVVEDGSLTAGNLGITAPNVTIGAAISITSGVLDLEASNALQIGGALSASAITLRNTGPAGITITAPVDASSSLLLDSGGDINEAGGGYISAAALAGSASGAAELGSSLNTIGILDGFAAQNFNFADSATAILASTLSAGSITLVTPGTLEVAAPVMASTGDVELVTGGLVFVNTGNVTAPADAVIAFAPYTPSAIEFNGSGGVLAHFSAGTVVLGAADGHAATGLVLAGSDSFAGTLQLQGETLVLQEGTLTAGDLGISAASIELAGLITTAGALDLDSSGTIADAGVLSAATLTFSAAAFGQGSSGTVTAGPITTGLLTGSAVSFLSLANLDNAIGALGAITIGTGDVLIGDAVPLEIAAPVLAQDIFIEDIHPGGISLAAAGGLRADGNILLTSDALSATAGATLSASAVTLTPYSATGIDLGGTSAGMLNLAQPVFTAAAGVPALQLGSGTASLATDGAIAVTAGTLLLDASSIMFNSALSASGVLALASPGGIAETSLGAVTAPTLIGTGILGNVALTAPANAIGTLGAITLAAGGTLALTDSGLLTEAGALNAPFVTLSAATLALPGDISAASQVLLDSAEGFTLAGTLLTNSLLLGATNGTITEGAGALLGAATLAGFGALGGLSLSGAGNTIASLGAFSLGTGSLALADTAPLTLTGTLGAGNASLAAPSLDFTGSFLLGQNLQLATTAGITEAAGAVITAATLAGANTGGGVALTGANSIASLGSFAFGAGNFALFDDTALTVNGPLTGGSATIAAAGLALDGNLRIANALTLASSFQPAAPSVTPAAGAVQSAGSITASALDLALTGDADLAGAGNTIASLSGFAGNITLADRSALAVSNLSGAEILLQAPAISFTGDADASATLTLDSPGAVTQSGGTLSAATLASAGAGLGTTALDQPGNAILNLGSFTASRLSLSDATPLTVIGPLDAANAALSAAGITFGGPVDVSGGLFIGGTGGASQTVAITAGTLTGALGADADLAQPGNSITTLGDFSTSGTLNLADATALNIAGAAAAAANLSAAGINLTGALVTSGATQLTSTAGITESADATLAAASLSGGSSGGEVALTGANSITSLGNFSFGAGTFALADTSALTLGGPLTGGAASLSAPGFVLAGNITATDALILASAGGLQQNSGAIATADLTLDTSGATALAGNANRIGNLSGNAGTVTLIDQQTLGVSNLAASDAALTAPAIGLGSGVEISGALALASPGAITQSAFLSAGTLSSNGATDGALDFTQPDNEIGTLGAFSASSLSLDDTIPLTLAGPVDVPVLSLDAPAMAFSGNVTASTLALGGTGDISQSSGVITAGTLTTGPGGIGGDTALGGANVISTLASVTDAGNFTLATGTPLTLAGSIATSTLALSSDGLFITGPITASTLHIESDGDLVESGAGVITTGLLTGSLAGGALLANPDNAVDVLAEFTATGGLAFGDSQALTLDGPVQLGGALTLEDPRSVTQTSGTLAATLLATTGTGIGGGLTLSGSGNAIPTFGDLKVAGNAAIADSAPLSLAGTLAVGGALTLADSGPITQASGILSAGTLNASATTLSLPDANLIGALGSISSTGNVLVNGARSLTGPLAAANATLTAASAFTLAGNAEIAGNLLVTAPGNLTQTGGTVSAQNVTLSAAAISLGGTNTASGTLDLLAAGDITQTAGALGGGTLTGTGGSLASFGAIGGTADFATLASFALADSAFTLENSGPLTLVGPVTASTVRITATGQLRLDGAGGGLFITGGLTPPGAGLPPGATASELAAIPDQTGAASIIQTGTFAINAAAATLYFVSNGGNIEFDRSAGLLAPSADIILAAGSQGSITGNVNAAQLEIYSANSVNLTGLIDGIGGSNAAGLVDSVPGPSPQYLFNACEIGVINCGIQALQILQESATTTTTANPVNKLYTPILTANPLENFDISQRKRRRLNKNVQLPGIATHDF